MDDLWQPLRSASRQKTIGGTGLVQGLGFYGSMSDAEILAHAGLLRMSHGSRGQLIFSVLPQGIDTYENKKNLSPPLAIISAEPQKFISAPEFKRTHGAAFASGSRQKLL